MSSTETVPFERLREWIGRGETSEDVVTPTPVAALAATLDRDEAAPRAGDELPPLWHWLYFLPLHRRSALKTDGHARLGGFLPPVPLPRRMWAGSRFDFHRPLRIGEAISRQSRIADVTTKTGRSGTLVFVRVLHEITGLEGLAITEEHDIVYREPAPVRSAGENGAGAAPPQSPADPAWTREIVPDEVLLFRYSALTFNAHRIHYDRPYAVQVEGYAGLIVHGPLIATLLLEHLRDRIAERGQGERITGFEFRARNPIVDTDRFAVCAEPGPAPNSYRLWARNAERMLCMDASATVE